jgi:putative ATP-binding cassette transporter
MLFLPQHPYLPLGDLRCQLLYRRSSGTSRMPSCRRLARSTGRLADRSAAWAPSATGKLLPVGEQQRLAFAPRAAGRPRYLLLDEATSALDADNERRLYLQLRPLSITPVSVSHHPALLGFHDQVLTLTGGGAWTLGQTATHRWNGEDG